MAIAGIDVGTTGCKISVYDENGTRLFKTYKDYPALRTVSEHEVDTDAIWEAVKGILTEAAAAVKDIRGLGVCSFGESFALLDKNDAPLTRAMLYTDPRGIEESEAFAASFGAERIADISGVTPHSMYSLPKLIWIKNHRPELWARAARALLMQDYVVYRLTGVAQIDYSLATRTMAFDVEKRAWSREILDAAGIDAALFSKPVPTGTPAGPVKREIAEATGLSPDAVVVSGCHDQMAAAVGSGVFREGVAADGAGTTECITPVFRSLDNRRAMYAGNYCIVPYLTEGRYTSYAFSFTGGGLVDWFRKTLAGNAKMEALEKGESEFSILEKGMGEGPTGILVLPHFAGAATPHMDPGAKGAFVGLEISHTLSDLYKAVLEGVAYEMRLNTEMLGNAGIRFDRLNATGGCAKSSAWLQIKADVLGKEIVSLGDSEAGIIGSIMLTGVAIGAYKSLEEAEERLIHYEAVFKPDPARHAAYEKLFPKYKALYAAVRPLI